MAAKGAGSFEATAGSKAGIQYWRIENLNPVLQADSTFGEVFEGDCYIFLHTKEKNGGSLSWELFFWLGGQSSQDEQGGAALRTVELDDQLGGGPVQFRETQGNESAHFLSMFPNKILRTNSGGVASAFNKVDRDAYVSRFFHLKGKKTVHANQCEMKSSQMNQGDVFILDEGKKIFQWNGSSANKYEKFKGLEMVTQINNDCRGGKAKCVFLESGKEDQADLSDVTEFWQLVGPKSAIKSAADGGEDKSKVPSKPSLYKVSDAGGSLKTTLLCEGHLKHEMLDDSDVFLVDVLTDVYVWVGSGASKEERRNAMKFGVEYVKNKGGAFAPNLQKFNAGSEPEAFKCKFAGWPEVAEAKGAEADTTAFYAAQSKKDNALDEKMNVGAEIKDIWRIQALDKQPLDKGLYGQFWAGDCFLILFKYMNGSKQEHIIYFWQGRDASIDEKATSALLAKQLDDDMGGDPVQVRVVMGKEPSHFLSMFKGKMIVHEGGVGSGFKNVEAKDTFDTDGISLFHVKGSNELNTRAVQVPEKASSLNSGDCFVLLTPDTMYIWKGEHANSDEEKTAHGVSAVMKGNRAEKTVTEGGEDAKFWSALGGKGDYVKTKPHPDARHEPRLFQLSKNTGKFLVTEVFDFDQSDLVADDVFLLDTHSEVMLWVGPMASKDEKNEAMTAALDYIKNCPDERDADTSVFRISANHEPPQFTQHFLGWDTSKASTGEDPYVAELKARGLWKGEGMVAVSADNVGFAKTPSNGGSAVSLEDLQGPSPPGVDPANKEQYLGDDVFQATFGMDKAKFATLPKWKRAAAKKSKKLF